MNARFPLVAALLVLPLALTPPKGPLPRPLPLAPGSAHVGRIVTREFFGLHVEHSSASRWPAVDFGSWRLIDAHVTWPDLEPARGQWRFARLDDAVGLAEKHHVEVVLPLAFSPTWASARPSEPSAYAPGNAAEPAEPADWTRYVRAVATRYRGRIHYYEIWNEPSAKLFFSGSVANMVALVREARRVLREVDPTVRVVCPAATDGDTAWLDAFLDGGGAELTDVVAFHAYVWPRPPEAMAAVLASVRAVMARHGMARSPLWNTESGWLIHSDVKRVVPQPWNRVLAPDEAAAWVARAQAVNLHAGVARFFYYAWDDDNMGLADEDGVSLKPAAAAYAEVVRWLGGATFSGCTVDGSGTWTCALERAGGHRAWMLWNPERTIDYRLPVGATRVRALPGRVDPITSRRTLPVGAAPVLVESR